MIGEERWHGSLSLFNSHCYCFEWRRTPLICSPSPHPHADLQPCDRQEKEAEENNFYLAGERRSPIKTSFCGGWLRVSAHSALSSNTRPLINLWISFPSFSRLTDLRTPLTPLITQFLLFPTTSSCFWALAPPHISSFPPDWPMGPDWRVWVWDGGVTMPEWTGPST